MNASVQARTLVIFKCGTTPIFWK